MCQYRYFVAEIHKGRVYFVNDRVTNICVAHAGDFQISLESEISEEQYFSKTKAGQLLQKALIAKQLIVIDG